ncbi:MAG: prk [Firmicutes bacterium]|nr:prk [Bacillota bacterium]
MSKINNILTKLHNFYVFIILVTFLKVILMGLFSSDYQNKMFMPFVDIFVTNISKGYFNPYEYYYSNHLLESFPYPPLMLYIESIGSVLIHIFGGTSLFFRNILFKLPNLFFDFMGLYFLMKLYPHRRKYVGILYFASPIILYSTYMHGQLDIIPTALLLGSIYYLLSKEPFNGSLFTFFLVAALSTKLHILAVLPVLFLYIVKQNEATKAWRWMIYTFIFTIVIMLPFMSQGLIATILLNNEQNLLSQVYFQFVNIKVYLPILAVLFVYLQEFMIRNINKDLLMSFCGVLFATFLTLLPPMPGWYVWIVPYVTGFFISVNDNKYRNLWVYLMLNSCYILYFIGFHKTGHVDLYFLNMDLSILKTSNEVLVNTVFTLLLGLLIYTTLSMYKLGIASNSLYKRKNTPFTIGIAGDSGAGKSTLVDLIDLILGTKNVLFIEGDGDHRWERGEKMWENYTHLNPKANYLYRQAMDVQTLRKGAYVTRVDYDHNTGKFTRERKIKPNKYILLCGLHSFYLPQMRKVLDLKVYMDIDETLRRYWKIQRDTTKRGYTKTKIVEQIESRMDDAQKYIIPQREYADLVIQYFDENLVDCYSEDYEVTLSLKLILSSSVNFEPLIQALSAYCIDITYDYSEDLQKQIIVFNGDSLKNNKIDIEHVANYVIPQLDEITKEKLACNNNVNGIIALVLLALISHKMQGEL